MGACGSAAPRNAHQPAAVSISVDPGAGNGDGAECCGGELLEHLSCTVCCSEKDLRMAPGTEKKGRNLAALEWARVGQSCRKGRKLNKAKSCPNQDAWSVLVSPTGNKRIYGVFDGHGDKGHDASELAKEMMPKIVARGSCFESPKEEELRPALQNAFQRVQSFAARRKWTDMSGTTATVVVHDVPRCKLSVAHVGDSTAVLGRISSSAEGNAVKAIQLTRDHKPDLEDEQRRIEASGGRVVNDSGNFRVVKRGTGFPGLNMSRSLGDTFAHDVGVLAEPEVSEHALHPDDQLLLVASDGIWEVIRPQEAMEIVVEAGALRCPKKAAETLATEATRRWLEGTNFTVVDDITVVLVNIREACTSPGLVRSDTTLSTTATTCSFKGSLMSDSDLVWRDEDLPVGPAPSPKCTLTVAAARCGGA